MLNHFKNSIGKEVLFGTVHTIDGKPVYNEVFKGMVESVEDSYIIIKYICVSIDEDFKVETKLQRRKLVDGEFKVLSDLNH